MAIISKDNFIEFCLNNNALKFGEFILKSGKKSNYFFNIGLFNTSESISKLGEFYADLIHNNNIVNNYKIDCLFGPAYKGIPLVISTSIALYNKYKINIPYAFNRKETKTHGEGGNIIGCDISNKNILLIDDVISAGTATKESIDILQQYNSKIAAIAIALDRQMWIDQTNKITASKNITNKYKINILNIINLDDLIIYTKNHNKYLNISAMLTKN